MPNASNPLDPSNETEFRSRKIIDAAKLLNQPDNQQQESRFDIDKINHNNKDNYATENVGAKAKKSVLLNQDSCSFMEKDGSTPKSAELYRNNTSSKSLMSQKDSKNIQKKRANLLESTKQEGKGQDFFEFDKGNSPKKLSKEILEANPNQQSANLLGIMAKPPGTDHNNEENNANNHYSKIFSFMENKD
jgi:hypothetical protein